ncbi:unnamed protein product [Fusarium graminearum]|uniref:Chromosome 4, complete genome n=1 Tax=Gibberella zeae (strain ATCC MYA-4620 / CBS 123657 / FGSC 9075 / NRRL 31084 / PH-1) TaxID=229533 RepID=I1RRI3_GIBZE|nr:hypothetical protein FGSG_06706 [Fusarium graminearum PH-1]EYB28177.1 hypothetical protein FG05_06706 [Fusarium graminearum]ESU12835.1 hypothetical protein FGSG_06706 [Fusarium graminearum PH-1]KAI6767111.1 hypothetical protein HG531_011471 [Fusarium graminearum]PCD19835.1 hypothetical protein FGRA07_05584 [Fusarium graminearum]CAF3468595.1 unnamed protein product [Fusarium graminearum]|eukprot:XP_011326342.1 hypothetical protein FGSG_06706 [Fusarium graminearum PH-1]
MASNGNFAQQDQYKEPADQQQTAPATSAADGSTTAAASANSNLSKDEVGWYFVEQYYTTLSKSPEKLHLFYGKRSQFVYGREAELSTVSVGRQLIQERIKELDFQDCKVRVSNVDSQASFENIVIQVIGETSNKGAEPRKFVQTFVLAQQPSGYFVLNDILRYIDEETEAEATTATEEAPEKAAEEIAVPATEEAAPPAEPEAPQSVEETQEEAPAQPLDPEVVDHKLEEVSTDKDSVTLNGSAAETSADEVKAPEVKPEAPAETADQAAKELAEEDVKEAEKPKDPSPTPVSKPVAAPPAAPEKPAGPPKPMTWASRAAAALPRPVVPLSKTPTPPVNQSRAPAPAAAAPTSQPAAAPASTANAPAAEAAPKEAAGWQTAGSDSKRQNRPQSVSGPPPTEKEGTLGYVKYVTDKVQDADLKNALAAFGELTYFDINRQKNCAFVEYKTPEGYQAAAAANPHTVNGESIVVEARRPKANAYGGTSYGGGRGPAPGRGRGGAEGGRSGGQGSRGNFSGQNRGRGGAARGRGAAAQPQNA